MHKNSLLAITLGLITLGSTHAMAVIGGGDSTPAELYKGAADSILPDNFSYAVTGSTTGKTAFITNNAALFGATGTVHFAASSSPLTAAERTYYAATYGASYGPLIQIPSVTTAVTIPYRKAGITALDLTSQQLCNAFSGTQATWGELLGTADPMPIRVVYNSNASGMTELLTRHLNTICPTQFGIAATFTGARLAGGTLPPHWVGVGSSGDVMPALNAVDGSIGYVGPDAVTATNNALVARVDGKLPTFANVVLARGLPVVPSGYRKEDPSQWIPVLNNPAAGYPIIGFTNFIFGQCYRDPAVAADVRTFITRHWGGVSTNGATVMHGFLPMVPAWKSAIYNTFVANTDNLHLDINNPNICHNRGRPL